MSTQKSKRKETDESGISREEGRLLIKTGNALVRRKIKGKEKDKVGLCSNRKLDSSDKKLGLILEGKGLVKIREVGEIDKIYLTHKGINFYIKNKNREFFK